MGEAVAGERPLDILLRTAHSDARMSQAGLADCAIGPDQAGIVTARLA